MEKGKFGPSLKTGLTGIGLAASLAAQPTTTNDNNAALVEFLKQGETGKSLAILQEDVKNQVAAQTDNKGFTIKDGVIALNDVNQKANGDTNTTSPIQDGNTLETGVADNFVDNTNSPNVKGFKTKSDVLVSVYGVSKEITGTTYNGAGLDIRGKQFEVKAEKGNNHTLVGGVGVVNVNDDIYLKGGAGLLNLDGVALGTEGTKYDLKSTNLGAAVGYRGTISDSTHTNLEVGRIGNTVTGTFGKVTGNTDFIEAAVETDFNDMKARLAGDLERTTAKTNYGDTFSDTTAGASATLYPTQDLALEVGYTGLDLHKGDYNAQFGVSIPFSEKGFESARPFVKANKNIGTHTKASVIYQSGIANVNMALKDKFEENIFTNRINPTMLKGVDSAAKKYEAEQRLRNSVPHAVNDVVSTAYNTPITGIDVLANDTYTNGIAPTLNRIMPNSQTHGTFTINNGKIDVVPEPNYTGVASCIYEIQGTNGLTSTATLTVNVGAVPTPTSAPASLDMTTASDSGTNNTDNITNLDPVFTWATVAGASSYEIKINSGSRTDIGNVTTYTATGLGDMTGATFSVRAKNASGTGPDSTTNFTIDTVTASRSGENISPMARGATITGNTMTFSKNIQSFTNIVIKDSGDNSVQGGSVSVTNISGTTATMTITWPAGQSPSTYVYIEGTVTDLAGNTSTVRTSGDYFQ